MCATQCALRSVMLRAPTLRTHQAQAVRLPDGSAGRDEARSGASSMAQKKEEEGGGGKEALLYTRLGWENKRRRGRAARQHQHHTQRARFCCAPSRQT